MKNEIRNDDLKKLPDFFNSLFPNLEGDLIEIRAIRANTRATKSRFYNATEDLLQDLSNLEKIARHSNLYFGVCPRSEEKGTKEVVKFVWCLWIDIDAKDFSGGKPEALARLRDFPLPPSIIVDSGNGYHAYWRFREPEKISGQNDISRIEFFLKALASTLSGDLKSAELARVLRVPGTQNLKVTSMPLRVVIVEFDNKRQYNLKDFECFLDFSIQKTPNNKSGWIGEALLKLSQGNRNGNFAKVAGRLRREGWEADDIIALLDPHAEKSAFPREELSREVKGICGRYPPKNSSPSSLYNSEKTETESKPFNAVLLSRLLESESEDIIWQVDHILPKQAVGILAGPAGYGKSWMLLDLAIEVSRSGEWLGKFQTQKGRVLYIDEESSEALLKKRLRKLIKAKSLQERELDIHFVIGQGLCFSSQDSVKRFRDFLNSICPSIIIIDSLIRVHRAEENSATDMAQVFRVIKEIIRDFKCSILFADHQKKPGNFGVSLDLLLRGSTEKAAFVDTLLSLQRKKDTLIVEHSKSRFAEAVPAFAVRIEDPTPDTTIVKYLGEAEELKQKARQEETHDFLTIALDGEWKARKNLLEEAKGAGISEKALDESLKVLEEEGEIERDDRKPTEGRGGKAAFYRRKQCLTSPSLLPELAMET